MERWSCKLIVRSGIKDYKLGDSYQKVEDVNLLQRTRQWSNTSDKKG